MKFLIALLTAYVVKWKETFMHKGFIPQPGLDNMVDFKGFLWKCSIWVNP